MNEMEHLEGFWDDENWNDEKWRVYKERRSGWALISNAFDQMFHRWMGVLLTRGMWEAREKKQWPSKTGSYDACEDHYNWLKGGGHKEEAEDLKEKAKKIRPEISTYF